MDIGKIRITTFEALPFAREKLRSALVLAGVSRVMSGQLVGMLSQTLRDKLPADISVAFDMNTGDLLLEPAHLTGRFQRLSLPQAPSPEAFKAMRDVLARLSREELLSDLERQVEERTYELNAEREKSERLLQNMLPGSVAKRLKNGETIADRHQASVMFVDMVGFTKWASQLNASQLVEYLGLIFGEFDVIVRHHGLEKIKTIGDCYMAAAGVPEAQSDHANRAVQAGLDIIGAMTVMRQHMGIDLQVRIGIHSGPLVAGVIGEVKPFYDIWGDTVNIASRMESHGMPNRLHISDDVRQALTSSFELEERGHIDIKNRGQILTWFVNGTV